jgi:hypothetical protein
MRVQDSVDMSSWESWQRDYRFGVILVMPPPHIAAPIDALRQAYDPKSYAICSAHISVSDPLRRDLPTMLNEKSENCYRPSNRLTCNTMGRWLQRGIPA